MSTLEHLYFIKLLMLVPIMIVEYIIVIAVFIGLLTWIFETREAIDYDEMD